jgi:hypothetical protein
MRAISAAGSLFKKRAHIGATVDGRRPSIKMAKGKTKAQTYVRRQCGSPCTTQRDATVLGSFRCYRRRMIARMVAFACTSA